MINLCPFDILCVTWPESIRKISLVLAECENVDVLLQIWSKIAQNWHIFYPRFQNHHLYPTRAQEYNKYMSYGHNMWHTTNKNGENILSPRKTWKCWPLLVDLIKKCPESTLKNQWRFPNHDFYPLQTQDYDKSMPYGHNMCHLTRWNHKNIPSPRKMRKCSPLLGDLIKMCPESTCILLRSSKPLLLLVLNSEIWCMYAIWT